MSFLGTSVSLIGTFTGAKFVWQAVTGASVDPFTKFAQDEKLREDIARAKGQKVLIRPGETFEQASERVKVETAKAQFEALEERNKFLLDSGQHPSQAKPASGAVGDFLGTFGITNPVQFLSFLVGTISIGVLLFFLAQIVGAFRGGRK